MRFPQMGLGLSRRMTVEPVSPGTAHEDNTAAGAISSLWRHRRCLAFVDGYGKKLANDAITRRVWPPPRQGAWAW